MAPRSLPDKQNPYLIEDVPDYADLLGRRALGQTKLNARHVDSGSPKPSVFDYAHLRAPLPKGIMSGIFSKGSPSSYFLMRRSSDGFVSATGMFKATFPYARAEEEEAERQYVKSLSTTSPEETAGNVWISPDQAMVLASEYGIQPWIAALLDPTDILVAGSQSTQTPATNKIIAEPPKYFQSGLVSPPTPTSLPRTLRSRRSASPSKLPTTRRAQASPRKRATKAATLHYPSSEESSAKASVSPSLSNAPLGAVPVLPVPVPALKPVAEDTIVESLEHDHPDHDTPQESIEQDGAAVLETAEEPKVKIIVDQDIKIDADGVETRHTNFEVELPVAGQPPSAEETARMLAEAKEMVRAAAESMTETTGPSQLEPTKDKRKIEDISVGEQEESAQDAVPGEVSEAPRAKKTKTAAEEKRDRVRKRALFGFGATLAVGAASALAPYVFGLL
ncbi:hypothetical protein GGTG_04053 [Gaeumannomyces tritici R3-111a-1]|uniref:HTH APSES-type domain-containing protein n=1 Tax=Gaeumannomyces tritici (strain R3-111a-1) TaxID=644352 RepID=J3NS05_GAET3|nr:hypothetical protein GGTG_04053 [Gaeumannomyces tritici R3-111a-1]EJT78961.1 hypothetical protein GGTG_04053 [Gaeumannomyces tritici R3-111a-1]